MCNTHAGSAGFTASAIFIEQRKSNEVGGGAQRGDSIALLSLSNIPSFLLSFFLKGLAAVETRATATLPARSLVLSVLSGWTEDVLTGSWLLRRSPLLTTLRRSTKEYLHKS